MKNAPKLISSQKDPTVDAPTWFGEISVLDPGGFGAITITKNITISAEGVEAGVLAAGINDWGGVSPVTPDHVNPEAPWPQLEALAKSTAASGATLVQRLAIYPSFVEQPERWLDPALRTAVLKRSGYEKIANVMGGMGAWKAAGLPTTAR